MKLVKDINQSIEMENKSSPADKLYNRASIELNALALVLLAMNLIVLYIDADTALSLFAIIFYPMVIMLIIGFMFAILEICRNHYFSTVLSLIIGLLALVGIIAFITVQAVVYKKVYIVPFMYFS